MSYYELVKGYTDVKNPDSISVAPYWLVYIIGLQTPLSFSRQKQGSVNKNATDGARSRLVITDDCTQLSVTNSKDSHTKSMRLQLLQGEFNYLLEILPGDWIMAWAFNNENKFREVYEKVKKGDSSNDFEDGLKFFGRVNSIRKNMAISPDGTKSSIYNLDCFSFRELDSQFFYDTALAESLLKDDNSYAWLSRIGINITKLFHTTKDGTKTDNAHLLISALLKILVGSGIASDKVNVIGPQTQIESAVGTTTEEAPYAYIVPSEVAQVFGKAPHEASKNSKIVSFADLLELYTGVQTYENKEANKIDIFAPKVENTDGIERFSGQANPGSFEPVFMGFTNKPVWSVLQQFQNQVVNELFTCLRVNKDGRIVPQVIFRQIPFTSPVFASINNQRPQQATINERKSINNQIVGENALPIGNAALQQAARNENELIKNVRPTLPVTPFHSLPRWRLHPTMVKSISLGRSDSMRTNFVHVYGQNLLYAKGSPNAAQQIVQNPPIKNDIDIQLNGLRSFMSTVASSMIDQVGKTPSAWMDLISDYMIGMHLTLNGTIETCGIHLPICEGDNLEWDDMLFHIEAVTHNCMITADGRKQFNTTLTVTNGVKLSDFDSDNGDIDPDNCFYSGFKHGDIEAYDPGITADSMYEQIKKVKT